MLEVKLSVCPEQTGELLPVVGGEGGGFTMIVVVLTVLKHPFPVDVTKTE